MWVLQGNQTFFKAFKRILFNKAIVKSTLQMAACNGCKVATFFFFCLQNSGAETRIECFKSVYILFQACVTS